MNRWIEVGEVESDTEVGVWHKVFRNPEGHHKCDCLGFRFCPGKVGSPEKTCKHLEGFLRDNKNVTERFPTVADLARLKVEAQRALRDKIQREVRVTFKPSPRPSRSTKPAPALEEETFTVRRFYDVEGF